MYAQLDENDQLIDIPDDPGPPPTPGQTQVPVKVWRKSASFQYVIDGVTYTAPKNWFAEWTIEQKNAAHMWPMKFTYDGQSTYDKDMYRVSGDPFTYVFDGVYVTEEQTLYQYSSGALPPVEGAGKQEALDIVQQGQVIWNQDRDRRSVGATPVIPDADLPAFEAWMKEAFDAQDAEDAIPPEPPASVRRSITMPDDTEGQCVISWFEFTGTWPGWGFKALFKRQDITALGLKVYDENGGYLYALTFQEGEFENEWVTETPAGYATSGKVPRSFEIIAGSAPVTEYITLDDTVEQRSFIVKWQSGEPI